jgi:hypothetical protein
VALIFLVSCDIIGGFVSEYNKNVAPAELTGNPTEVSVGVYLNYIRVDIEEQTATISAYLRQSWNDSRLQHLSPDDATEQIWMPDIFIRNLAEPAKFDHSSLRVRADGTVWSVKRMFLKLPVKIPQNDVRRPKYKIELIFESFGYTAETLQISAMRNPIDGENENIYAVPRKTLIKSEIASHDCSMTYESGTFPCLGITMWLKSPTIH